MTAETESAGLPWNPAKAKAHMRKWVGVLLQEVRDLRENMAEWGDSEEEFRLGLEHCLGESPWSVEYHAARAKGLSSEDASAVADLAIPEEER